jgi:hypothetical protein
MANRDFNIKNSIIKSELCTQLNSEQLELVLKLLDNKSFYSHEQFPPFAISANRSNYLFYIQYNTNQISAFAAISIK